MSIDTRNCLQVMAIMILSMRIIPFAAGEETAPQVQNQMWAMNTVVVSPEGPRDGGDFGPYTPGTKTSGIQEAFDFAKANRKDVTIAGGTMPGKGMNGVVYHIQETIRIPWFQDFRLDGGEYVINYDKETGDAIVIDSQMSCRMKFGLIVCPSDGAAVRLKPETKGPDGFAVITTCTFEFNALVGAGSVFQDGKRTPRGVGLCLDACNGPIVNNKFYATEIIACEIGLLLHCGPGGNASTAIDDNSVEVPFMHLCSTHMQIGDPDANVRRNEFRANIDGSGVTGAIGAHVYGKQNLFTLDVAQTAPGNGIVFDTTAEANLVTLFNMAAGVTNKALRPTSRIVSLDPVGFSVETPGIPASGVPITNRSSFGIDAMFTAPGSVTEWSLTDSHGVSKAMQGPLGVAQTIRMEPGDSVCFTYTQSPQWIWRSM